MKNRGIDLAREERELRGDEWQFGAASERGIADIPMTLRTYYLPIGERQYGLEDFTDCATRAPLNTLEAQLTYLLWHGLLLPETVEFLRSSGYVNPHSQRVELSDRFNAVLSGTTRNGNSMKAPLESIRKDGCIPKSMLPARSDMDFNAYHDRRAITAEMQELGRIFAHRIKVAYEQVPREMFKDAIDDDMLCVAGFAWPTPIDGVYPRIEGNNYTHEFLIYAKPAHQIFDNYEEAPEDFTKNLAPDFNFYPYGYRVYIARELSYTEQVSLFQRLVARLTGILRLKQS